MEKDLKLIVMNNAKALGERVDEYLKHAFNTDKSFIVETEQVRFNNGEAKTVIKESIRNDDVYILCDVGNHSLSYDMYGKTSYLGPDEHFQDLKRFICATMGHANSINVIMPLLYESRQHRRKGRESLDCAMALQELERLGVTEIITFDAHDPNIQNAIPCSSFDNFYPTANIVEAMMTNISDFSDYLVISPDVGAVDRARFYADMLRVNVGLFYKRRDLTKIVNWKNPIIEHAYLGSTVLGKTCIVVDDMIASGTSIIEVVERLKKLGAKKVFFVTTFSLFTEGIEVFNESYKNNVFEKLYTTNLSYISIEYRKEKWLKIVDCSKRIADVIDGIHDSKSLDKLCNDNERVIKLLDNKR